jgi:hypothetical protein
MEEKEQRLRDLGSSPPRRFEESRKEDMRNRRIKEIQ